MSVTVMKSVLRRLGASLVVLALAGACAMTPADDDPTLLRLQSLERRLEAIERILANGSLVELTLQVDELQRRSAEVQGRVEQLEYEREGSGERQRALYADLDDRLQSLENRLGQLSAGAVAAAAADEELPVPGGTDQQNYQAAFELLKEQRYEQAAAAFAQFLSTYPDSQLADNAQYWL
ncbi:MAG: YbgF trimerization domain-containing protein, partial [Pseudomonadota bacterium]